MMDFLTTMLPPLALLFAANGAPILAKWLLQQRFNAPLDSGHRFVDGRPLLGPAKSWRGLIAAVVVTGPLAMLFGFDSWLGALFALLAMLGDALASFIKRRLGVACHGRLVGLDQLPEAILPLWVLRDDLGLLPVQVLWVALIFMCLEIVVSPLLYRWHLRSRPY